MQVLCGTSGAEAEYTLGIKRFVPECVYMCGIDLPISGLPCGSTPSLQLHCYVSLRERRPWPASIGQHRHGITDLAQAMISLKIPYVNSRRPQVCLFPCTYVADASQIGTD